jgi:hypothetical protein
MTVHAFVANAMMQVSVVWVSQISASSEAAPGKVGRTTPSLAIGWH